MTAAQHHHIVQRVRVGAIGLAIVVLLIMVAGAILGAVTRDRPATTAGAAKADAIANLTLANDAAAAEPLAAMGVTPAAGNASAAK